MEKHPEPIRSLADIPLAVSPDAVQLNCPTQVLAIDRVDGPAHILIDMISRVFESRISYILAENRDQALFVLDCCEPSLIVFGLDARSMADLTLLPDLRASYPGVPVVAIYRELDPINRDHFRQLGLGEILALPRHAADSKKLVLSLARRYLIQN